MSLGSRWFSFTRQKQVPPILRRTNLGAGSQEWSISQNETKRGWIIIRFSRPPLLHPAISGAPHPAVSASGFAWRFCGGHSAPHRQLATRQESASLCSRTLFSSGPKCPNTHSERTLGSNENFMASMSESPTLANRYYFATISL